MYCFKLPLSFAGRYQASGCASRNESVTMKGKTNRFFSLPLLSYDRLVNSGCPDFALFPRIATPTETSSIHERGTRSVFFFLFGPKNDYPLFFFFFLVLVKTYYKYIKTTMTSSYKVLFCYYLKLIQ